MWPALSAGARRRILFATALGFSDGILTALMLAAGRLWNGDAVSLDLTLRIAAAGALSGLATLFLAEYARLRLEMSRAAAQLNLATPHRLISSALGRAILKEATGTALISAFCSFLGALIPLLTAPVAPGVPAAPVAAALTALAALGGTLGRVLGGQLILWALALVGVGAAIGALGIWLNVLG
jgi:VIT1/CCC1 family predicted Fe2+/Mn2+ transporter